MKYSKLTSHTIFILALIVASIGQAITKWAGLQDKWVWPAISFGMASISRDHWVVVMTTLTGQVELEQRLSIWSTSVEKFFLSCS